MEIVSIFIRWGLFRLFISFRWTNPLKKFVFKNCVGWTKILLLATFFLALSLHGIFILFIVYFSFFFWMPLLPWLQLIHKFIRDSSGVIRLGCHGKIGKFLKHEYLKTKVEVSTKLNIIFMKHQKIWFGEKLNNMDISSTKVKYFNTFLTITGISLKKSSICFLFTVFRYVFMIFMTVTMVAAIILIFRFWLPVNSSFDPDNIQIMVIHVSYVEGLLDMWFLLYWQRKKKFKNHFAMLLICNRSMDNSGDKKNINFLCKILLLISCGFIAFGFTSGLCLIETNSAAFERFSVLRGTFFEERLHYLIHLHILYILFALTISFSSFSTTCFIDRMELKTLNKLLLKQKVLNAFTLKAIFDKHNILVKVVEQANDTYKFYILKTFAFMVPLIVLILYDLAVAEVALAVKLIYGAAVAFFITYILVLNLFSASVNTEVSNKVVFFSTQPEKIINSETQWVKINEKFDYTIMCTVNANICVTFDLRLWTYVLRCLLSGVEYKNE